MLSLVAWESPLWHFHNRDYNPPLANKASRFNNIALAGTSSQPIAAIINKQHTSAMTVFPCIKSPFCGLPLNQHALSLPQHGKLWRMHRHIKPMAAAAR